jgi:exosortase N
MEISLKNNISKLGLTASNKIILPILVFAIGVFLLKDYFMPGIQIALGIMIAPFVFTIKKTGAYSHRYAIISTILLLAFYLLHIKILLFLGVGCLLLYTIEIQWGKLGMLPFLFLICISPALHYLVNSFTFPIRLQLSAYAAEILNFVGLNVINKGSYFILPNGQNYSVDNACIGLNMFNTGLSMTILMLGFSEQQTKKSINIPSLLILGCATVFLLILTNLLRIVALVFFHSEAGTIGHDMIGILSLIIYTLTPMYFLIRFFNRKYGRINQPLESHRIVSFKKVLCITSCIAIGMLVVNENVKDYLKDTIKDKKLAALELNGYTKKLKDDGVFEYRNNSTLIYIKPANKGFESDHPPSQCWQGSGFKLNDISETTIENFTIYTATLKKDSVIQYTAWWYDNGTNKTISQLEWRFAKEEPYRIVNITTADKINLEYLCSEFLNKKLF